MKNKITISEAIKRLAGKEPTMLVTGVVQAVDDTTADVLIDELGLTISDIPLRADVETSGAIVHFKPKVGSEVTIGRFKGYGWIILSVSIVDLIWLGGKKYSVPKGEDLVEELNKLNNLVSALVQVINTPLVEPFTSPAQSVLQTTLQAALASQSVGSFTNVLNDKLKHGT